MEKIRKLSIKYTSLTNLYTEYVKMLCSIKNDNFVTPAFPVIFL